MENILKSLNINNYDKFYDIVVLSKEASMIKYSILPKDRTKNLIKELLIEIDYTEKLIKLNNSDIVLIDNENIKRELELIKFNNITINNLSFNNFLNDISNINKKMELNLLLIKLKEVILKHTKNRLFIITIVFILYLVNRINSIENINKDNKENINKNNNNRRNKRICKPKIFEFEIINKWFLDLFKELNIDDKYRLVFLNLMSFRYLYNSLLKNIMVVCNDNLKNFDKETIKDIMTNNLLENIHIINKIKDSNKIIISNNIITDCVKELTKEGRVQSMDTIIKTQIINKLSLKEKILNEKNKRLRKN